MNKVIKGWVILMKIFNLNNIEEKKLCDYLNYSLYDQLTQVNTSSTIVKLFYSIWKLVLRRFP